MIKRKNPIQITMKKINFFIILAYGSSSALALDLTQSPPGTTEPYVRPNVIISIDDSGSMDFRLTSTSNGDSTKEPDENGNWPNTAKRMNVLKYSLKSIFDTTHPKYDSSLMPEKRIRLSWQAMHNNGGSSGAASVVPNLNWNSTAISSMNENSMRVLEGTHRQNFLSFVDKLSSRNGTPTPKMFSQADRYMRFPVNKNGPWSSNPGGTDSTSTEYLACRRNYHIVMSDGRWNGSTSGGSQDSNEQNKILPNGTRYGSTFSSNRPNNKIYHDNHSNTLADWAFKSWSDPLITTGLTGIPKQDPNLVNAPQKENFGKDTSSPPKDAELERFWNPKYNPATWVHMVTYTIGFSNDAITWPGSTIIAPTEKLPFGYDGSFPDLVTGRRTWPAMSNENVRALDMWHAALNGRGRFYAVEKGEDLAKAFRDIFQQINNQTEPETTSSATSGSNITRTEVGQFIAAYEPINSWKGFLTARTISKEGAISDAWNGKNTAQILDLKGHSERKVLSWSDQKVDNKEKGGVEFKFKSDQTYLSTEQKNSLKNSSGDLPNSIEQRINYIRGDRSYEGNTTAKPYRVRHSIQGDIVNSDVWYLKSVQSNYLHKNFRDFISAKKDREAMLYVGGNDGMLHGFSADNGEEKIAYVPKGVISNLKLLTAPAFDKQHKYFVDGSPMSGDIDTATPTESPIPDKIDHTPNWRSILLGTLGAGGKGYFALDVTTPEEFSTATAKNIVVLDKTRGTSEGERVCTTTDAVCIRMKNEEADIGHITAKATIDPGNSMRSNQFTRLNNNRWAVILGNGYNSTNQRAVLLIQYLDGGKELLAIPTTDDAPGTGLAKDNGLSSPTLVDINNDGRADIVYAGDNLGNLWKFDITSQNSENWNVAFNKEPLFTAKGPSSLNASEREKTQSITAPPIVRANNRKIITGTGTNKSTDIVGGLMVAFGTGRNLEKYDTDNVDVQTLYSVLDSTRYSTNGTRVSIHPGAGTCAPIRLTDCIPSPQSLGTGISSAKLAQQKITENSSNFDAIEAVDELNENTWNNYNGWYIDLPVVGERILKPLQFFDGSNILAIYSQVPAKGSDIDPNTESCEASGVEEERQFLTTINIIDGKRSAISIFDTNNDSIFDDADLFASRKKIGKGARNLIKSGRGYKEIGTKPDDFNDLGFMPITVIRPSWRQFN